MVRPHFFISLEANEAKELSSFLAGGFSRYGLRARRRAQAVWFSYKMMTVPEIARRLRVSERHLWNWLKNYQAKGLDGLKGKYVYTKL